MSPTLASLISSPFAILTYDNNFSSLFFFGGFTKIIPGYFNFLHVLRKVAVFSHRNSPPLAIAKLKCRDAVALRFSFYFHWRRFGCFSVGVRGCSAVLRLEDVPGLAVGWVRFALERPAYLVDGDGAVNFDEFCEWFKESLSVQALLERRRKEKELEA